MILYACGSDLIVDYIEVCSRNGVLITAIINNGFKSNHVYSIDVAEYNFDVSLPFLVPLFNPFNRYKAVQEALNLNLIPYPLLSDRNNDLPIVFKHGVGCFINKGLVLGATSRLGDYVLINRGACLGHHIEIGDYASIGPGVTTGGGVKVGRGAMIGTGAVIMPEIKIGDFAVVGAGAVVNKDVPDHSVVVGNPSKEIKKTSYDF